MLKVSTNIKEFYIGLYAEYIFSIDPFEFDKAVVLLQLLPGLTGYNVIERLSDTTVHLQIGEIVLIITTYSDCPDVVSVSIEDDSVVADDVTDIESFLSKHNVYPNLPGMLTLNYIKAWNHKVQTTTVSVDDAVQYLKTLIDVRCAHLS